MIGAAGTLVGGGLALPQNVRVMLSGDPVDYRNVALGLPGGDRRSGSAHIIVRCTRPDAVAVQRILAASTG
ncbi:MAG: hypothetical protein ABJA86_12420, partial [Nocardioidaceae bacterium]